jgi:hypothetical protein
MLEHLGSRSASHTFEAGSPGGLRAVVRGIGEELGRRLQDTGSAISFPEAMCFSLTNYLEGDDRIPRLAQGAGSW